MRIGPVILTLILVSIVGFYSWQKFSPSTSPALALQDEDPQVRESAAQQLGGLRDEAALEPLIAALQDEDARVRRAAAAAMQHVLPAVKDPQTRSKAVEPLIRALGDSDRDARGFASFALTKIGEPAIALAEIGEPALEPLISMLLDENFQVRSLAAEKLFSVLSMCRPDTRGKALDHIFRAMKKEGDRNRRRAVAVYLGRMGEPVFESLLAVLQDEDVQVRGIATLAMQYVLPAVEDPQTRARAVEPLINAMKDDDREQRLFAPAALTQIGEPALEPLLLIILEEGCEQRCCEDVCCSAALAIREILGAREDGELNRRIFDPLIDRLSDETQDPAKRANAAYGLGQILWRSKDPAIRHTVASVLITALEDQSQEVRLEAASGLSLVLDGSKDPDVIGQAVGPLLAALRDDSTDVRERVAYALGVALSAVEEPSASKKVEESLVLRLKNPDESGAVRDAVAWALCKIGTEEARKAVRDAGFDPDLPPTPRAGRNEGRP